MRRRVATQEKRQHLQVQGKGLGDCRRRRRLLLICSRRHDDKSYRNYYVLEYGVQPLHPHLVDLWAHFGAIFLLAPDPIDTPPISSVRHSTDLGVAANLSLTFC